MKRIETHVVEPYKEADLYPLALYRGAVSLGRIRAVYNYFCAAMEAELSTIGRMVWVTQDGGWRSRLAHLTGLHGQYGTNPTAFHTMGTRLLANPQVIRTPHLEEYLRFLREHGGLKTVPLTPVPRWTGLPTKRLWRYDPTLRVHKVDNGQPVVLAWPYVGEHTPKSIAGLDLIEAIDAIVPTSLAPATREDVCQDLAVAVLTGEVNLGNLRDALPKYLDRAFKQFPIKYGHLSLDSLPPWDKDGRTLGESLVATMQNNYEAVGLCSSCDRFSEELDNSLCPDCYAALAAKIQTEHVVIPNMLAQQRDPHTYKRAGGHHDIELPGYRVLTKKQRKYEALYGQGRREEGLSPEEYERMFPGRIMRRLE